MKWLGIGLLAYFCCLCVLRELTKDTTEQEFNRMIEAIRRNGL